MSLSAAVLRALPVAPLVAVWLVCPCPLVERVTFAVCGLAFGARS